MTHAGIADMTVIKTAIHPKRAHGYQDPKIVALTMQEHDGVMTVVGGGKTKFGKDPVPRCMSNNRSGERCKNPVVGNLPVCSSHVPGINSPNISTRAQANVRLAALVEPAITVLTKIMADDTAKDSDRIKAADSLLDRAGMGRHKGWMDDASAAKEVLIASLLEKQAEASRTIVALSAAAVSPNDPSDDDSSPVEVEIVE